MNINSLNKLKRKIYFIFPLSYLLLASIFMLFAGSLKFWQGWLFCFLLLTPSFFVTKYFFKKSPEFIERRLKFKEKELKQKKIIKMANILFLFVLVIPGLDYRFGWSNVPIWLVAISNTLILAGYYLVFLSFKENSFAGRTVEVFKGQKVIDTGPYLVVRHPMYAGVIPMFLFMSIALGSYWAIIPIIPVCIIIIFRIINEEEVLKRDLPGYKEYCKKVKYRIIPFVW